MKRNLTLLTILGALIAVAVPASAMAKIGVYPAGHKFEISGANMPTITGSLPGSCTLTKIAATVPAAPQNEGAESVVSLASVPTASCGAGVSIAVAAGEWKFGTYGRNQAILTGPVNGLTLRYSSLPGCKLATAAGVAIAGVWSNGVTSPFLSRSSYHGDGTLSATWADDGAGCAMSGTKEALTIDVPGIAQSATVNDITNPGNVIQIVGGI